MMSGITGGPPGFRIVEGVFDDIDTLAARALERDQQYGQPGRGRLRGQRTQIPGDLQPGRESCTPGVFAAGHRIRPDVQPRDGIGSRGCMHCHADDNTGTNTLHAGGAYESYLLLPVIPA